MNVLKHTRREVIESLSNPAFLYKHADTGKRAPGIRLKAWGLVATNLKSKSTDLIGHESRFYFIRFPESQLSELELNRGRGYKNAVKFMTWLLKSSCHKVTRYLSMGDYTFEPVFIVSSSGCIYHINGFAWFKCDIMGRACE